MKTKLAILFAAAILATGLLLSGTDLGFMVILIVLIPLWYVIDLLLDRHSKSCEFE